MDTKEGWPIVKQEIVSALKIDDSLAEAHTLLGYANMEYDWNWGEAEKHFKLAIALKPGNAFAHSRYSTFLTAIGKKDEAIAEINIAHELDPLSLIVNLLRGALFWLLREYDMAIDCLNEAITLEPNYGFFHWYLGYAYLEKKMYKQAIDELQKSVKLVGSDHAMLMLARGYALSGGKSDAWNILNEFLEKRKTKTVSAFWIAAIYAALEEKNKAFEWLERAFIDKEPFLAYAKVDPQWDNLRSDQRFSEFVKKMGF